MLKDKLVDDQRHRDGCDDDGDDNADGQAENAGVAGVVVVAFGEGVVGAFAGGDHVAVLGGGHDRFRRGRGDDGGKFGKKLLGHGFGGGVDEAGAELRHLAADLGVDGVGEEGAAGLVGEGDLGAAFGEAGDAALAFAGDGVAVRGIEV